MPTATVGEIAQLIVALCTVCTLVSHVVALIVGRRRLDHIAHEVNSVKDELVAATRSSALAEGELAGREGARRERAAESG